MEIYLAKTQGFCAGVSYAISIVEKALKKYKNLIYVYHDIVHNTHVINNFKARGVIFIEHIEDVPDESILIFSAHGVPPQVVSQAQAKNLTIIDATCPLVRKVHKESITYSNAGYSVILIGKRGHQEIIGTAGYVKPDLLNIVETIQDMENLSISTDKTVAYITQTTLSIDDTKEMITKLRQRFPNLISPPSLDICYATQNRQSAVKALARLVEIIIICGSPNSSNSNRLKEIGEKEGVTSLIIDNADELTLNHLTNKTKIGVSSGASVPQIIVDQVIKKITKAYPDTKIKFCGEAEKNVSFTLPKI